MELAGLLNYLVGFFIMVGIYGIFSLGLNLQWGFTGLFNAGIAGFFALGAYTSALLTTPAPDSNLVEDFVFGGNLAGIPYLDWGIDVWFILSLAAVALVCGIVAYLVGRLTLRLSGDYLAIATLGIAEAVRLMFLNEKWIANGSKGLYRIPEFLGNLVSPKSYDYLFLAVVAVVLILLYLAVQRAVNSPWGRVLRAIREDEVAAQASGKDVYSFKMQAFIFGSNNHGHRRRAVRSSYTVHCAGDLRPTSGDLCHLGDANGGRVWEQQGRPSGCLRGVGHLVGDSVFAVVLRRPKLPVLHDRGLDCWGDSAAPGGNIGRDAESVKACKRNSCGCPQRGQRPEGLAHL